VVSHDKDSHLRSDNPVIDPIRESSHQKSPLIALDESPTRWRRKDLRDAPIKFIEELATKANDRVFVKTCCLYQLSLSRWMVVSFIPAPYAPPASPARE
jgi:hypothetical protein